MMILEAADFLEKHDHYVILTHRRPDGDTTGCAVALALGLRELGKQAAIYENPQFTPRFAPYLAGLTCPGADADATVVSVDLASETLVPFGAEEIFPRVSLAIDHHGSQEFFAERTCLDAEAAACG